MSGIGSDKLRWSRAGLVLTVLALTVIGVLFVHSTTARGEPFPSTTTVGHLRHLAISLLAFVVVSRFDYRLFDRLAYLLYAAVAAVLLWLLVTKTGKFNRCLELPGIGQLQPSEFMKMGLVLALARYLRYRRDQQRLSGLVVPIGLTSLSTMLVVLQPDLGTSLLFPVILLGMLYVAGTRPRHVVLTLVAAVSLLPLAYWMGGEFPLLRGYQFDRVKDYVTYLRTVGPGRWEGDLEAASYQLEQSIVAVGSGGMTGQGLGRGYQNLRGRVPERNTDFIFSILGEEWGFVGAAGVVLLFLALVCLLLRTAYRTREPFGRLVLAGIALGFAAQSFQNMAMTIGLTPITGLTLPFVSKGGTSLLTSFLALGVAVGCASRRVRVVASGDLIPDSDPRRTILVEEGAAALLRHRWPMD